MQNINELFNQIFKTSKENYVSSNKAILNCRKKFSSLEDDISVKVFLYFFPVDSKSEKNKDEFWFLKYKNDKEYDEYDFAEDLLKNYADYLSDKNKNIFEEKLKHILLKFGNYKLFTLYIYNMLEYKDNLMSTVAYFTKDSSFYQEALNAFILPENIQTENFIQNIKDLIKKKIIFLDKMNEADKLQKQVNLLKGKLEIKENKEKDLQKKIIELSEKILYNEKIISGQLKDLQENKIKTDSQIKSLREETKIQIKDLREEEAFSQIKSLKEKTESQIKSLQEEKIQVDLKLKILMDDKIKKDEKLIELENNTKKLSLEIENLKMENKKLKDSRKELQNEMDKIELRDAI